jgi:hypothetical protein
MTKRADKYDYASSGMNIWQAMLDRGKKRAKTDRGPVIIRCAGKTVPTADIVQVPRGTIRLECIHCADDIRQGFDIKMKGGCMLAGG